MVEILYDQRSSRAMKISLDDGAVIVVCSQRWVGCRVDVTRKRRVGRYVLLKYSSLGGGYGEENFVYLSSYVLASRSSDVSSQFGRLQSDQLQLQARGETGRGRKERKKVREAECGEQRIRRTKPEGKGADFYANICETLRRGKATHTRNEHSSSRIPPLVKGEMEKGGNREVLSGTSCAEFRRHGSRNLAPTTNGVRLP